MRVAVCTARGRKIRWTVIATRARATSPGRTMGATSATECVAMHMEQCALSSEPG